MRTAFFETLVELAQNDRRIMLVVGDLGFKVTDEFREKCSNQFLNAGVAEQNMTSLSAGLALSGKIVFTYSIANFPTLRCLEQIRNDVCYHNANVKVVSVGGGFTYGNLGMTHHGTEDLAILRTLPEMTVLAPGDPVEVSHATRAIVEHNGPAYLRLGRAGEPLVHTGKRPILFELGKALFVTDGADLTIISTGGMLQNAVEVGDRLADVGISARVLSMHTIKPIDKDAIIKAAQDTSLVVTLEEHSIIGGLGSAVAEVLAESDLTTPWRLKRLGVPSTFAKQVGDQDYLRDVFGLTPDKIMATIEPLVSQTPRSG